MSSPHHATHKAVAGIADRVADRLAKSTTYVYSMGEDPEKDRYTRFVQLYLAIAAEDWEKAEVLYRDFETRRNALSPKRQFARTTETKALASLSEKVSDLLKSHLEGKAEHEKLQAVAEVEEVCRQLSQAIIGSTVAVIGRAERERDARMGG
jgi:hypothetical protein